MSVLIDDHCAGTGIAVSTPESFKGETELTKAFGVGRPGTFDKSISGTFVGVLKWQPKCMPNRIKVLKEVRDLTTVMK
jgi:hypothetical protein